MQIFRLHPDIHMHTRTLNTKHFTLRAHDMSSRFLFPLGVAIAVAPSFSTHYRKPLLMTKGRGTFLFDHRNQARPTNPSPAATSSKHPHLPNRGSKSLNPAFSRPCRPAPCLPNPDSLGVQNS